MQQKEEIIEEFNDLSEINTLCFLDNDYNNQGKNWSDLNSALLALPKNHDEKEKIKKLFEKLPPKLTSSENIQNAKATIRAIYWYIYMTCPQIFVPK